MLCLHTKKEKNFFKSFESPHLHKNIIIYIIIIIFYIIIRNKNLHEYEKKTSSKGNTNKHFLMKFGGGGGVQLENPSENGHAGNTSNQK